MKITTKLLDPSREDAVRLTRNEKTCIILLAHACSVLEDLKTDIAPRLAMVDNGQERMVKLSADADAMLHDLRLTIPEEQRHHLQNTAKDYEVRLAPKMSPFKTTVVMQKDEFKSLVDHARAKCMDCTEDDRSCEKCTLYKLLTVVLPMDDYHDSFLCPYNMREWGN